MRSFSNDRSCTESLHAISWTSIVRRVPSPRSVVTLLLLAILLMSCGTLGGSPGSTGTLPSQNTRGGNTALVHIAGSTALLPLAAKAANLFHQHYPDVQVEAQGGGSVIGLRAVVNHQADIGDSDIYADPVLYPDPNLTDHIVCVGAFTLIVDPQVGITSLTTQQIIAIFTGKITNWKEVGGPDLHIKLVIRPNTSGTRILFRKYVLGGLEESGPTLTSDSSTTVLDAVAHTPGAIGYVTTTLVNPTVKAIGIDGVSATEHNIQSGKYKFWGYEHMYTLDNGIDATTAFLDFMQSAQIQRLAQKLGYIPVTAIQTAQQR